MTDIHRWGYFRELPHEDPGGPSLTALVRPDPQPHEAEIVAYLKAGICMSASGLRTQIISAPSGHFGVSAS